MEAASNDDRELILYGATEEYTAECTHGYAEIGMYMYVVSIDKFNIEEVNRVQHTIWIMVGLLFIGNQLFHRMY